MIDKSALIVYDKKTIIVKKERFYVHCGLY